MTVKEYYAKEHASFVGDNMFFVCAWPLEDFFLKN